MQTNLYDHPIFRHLDEDQLEEHLSHLEKIDLEDGEILFEKDAPGDYLYFVETGLLKITVPDSVSGRNKTLALLGDGEVVGELAVVTDESRSGRATAVRDTTLHRMNEDDFLNLLQSSPETGLELIKVLSERLLTSDRELQTVTFNTIPGRLAAKLLDLMDRFGEKYENGVTITIPLTHERLADLVGTNRETITRHLNRFQKNGTISIEDQRITVLDPPALERLV